MNNMNTDKNDDMNEIERLVAFLISCIPDAVKNVLTVSTALQGLDKNDDGTVTVAVKADGTVSTTGKGKHVFGSVAFADLLGALSTLAQMQLALPAPTPTASVATIAYRARATVAAVVNGVIHVSTYAFFGKNKNTGKGISEDGKKQSKRGVTLNGVKVTAHSSPAYFLLNSALLSGGYRILVNGMNWETMDKLCWNVLMGFNARVNTDETGGNVIYRDDDRLSQLHAGFAKVDNIPTIGADEARSACIEAGLSVAEAGQQTTTVSKAKPVYDLDI